MKNLFVCFAAVAVLFVMGCQENSIIDPVLTESINKNQTTSPKIIRGSIPLEGILVVHGGFQTYYDIEGQINYTHELFPLDPAPPAPQYYINLNLSVRATLTDEGHNAFRISSQSEDIIYDSGDRTYILQKSFPVLGRNDGLVLVCRFIVTTDGIGLNAKWLAFKDDHRTNKNSVTGDPFTLPTVRIDMVQ